MNANRVRLPVVYASPFPWIHEVSILQGIDDRLGVRAFAQSGESRTAEMTIGEWTDDEVAQAIDGLLAKLNDQLRPDLGQFGIMIASDGAVFTRAGVAS